MPSLRKGTGVFLGLSLWLLGAAPASADVPSGLPRYDLDMHVDVAGHVVHVRQRVTWVNPNPRPAHELVFNAHSHFQIPKGKGGFYAKMLEILRMPAGVSLEGSDVPPPLQVQKVSLAGAGLPFHYQEVDEVKAFAPAAPEGDHAESHAGTALVVPLPRPVAQGESVTVELEFNFRLPQKQGRWGQWEGVTFLATWLPVVAVYGKCYGTDDGECRWQPTPFIPWHQPFFNEAGIYSVRATLPCDQKIACTAAAAAVKELGDGTKQVDFAPICARDFAFLCSARYQEYVGQAGPVQVRCLALPEHEYYARLMLQWVCEAIPVYSRWFGPYPYPQFTVAESYFGWNGNECGGLVMIDERVFGLPHLAGNFVEYLVSHELCHQWWYNAVGTNGYCETWMDEGFVTHFSHRLMDKKQGANSTLLSFPNGLGWLPNIHRENYRNAGLLGTIGRGDAGKTVDIMPKYGHLADLLSMCYDRGSKVVAMIEERLGGEGPFLEFMRHVYARYQFRILRVDDFREELESYTGRDWKEFFKHWVTGPGEHDGAAMCDWAVEKVRVEPVYEGPADPAPPASFLAALHRRPSGKVTGYKATVLLDQRADYAEETVLGICLDGGEGYQVRIPIPPAGGALELDDPPARVEPLQDHRHVRVEVLLPCPPTQISVDPDAILVDPDRANNHWKPKVRVHWAPLYTPLEETAFTNDYDKFNVNFGLGVVYQAYTDPWYTRSAVVGARANVFRTEQFTGGAYAGYRTNDRSVVAGVDGLWEHFPWPSTQVGFNLERRLTSIGNDDNHQGDQGVVFGRYVFQYGSSLYLPPINYAEVFGAILDHALLEPYQQVPGANHFDHQTEVGVHYHLDYLTPYWDPEGGFRFDIAYATGIPIFGEHQAFNRVDGQFSIVQGLPDALGPYLSDTRLAARVYGAAGLPNNGEYYTLGGANLFRGFDVRQRQGSMIWLASLEWRLPVVRHVEWDFCDHVVGIRNIWLAPFYDVGNAYVNGHEVGSVAHALGLGLRIDTAVLSLIERASLRFDVAKTLNSSAGWQFWFGVQQPF